MKNIEIKKLKLRRHEKTFICIVPEATNHKSREIFLVPSTLGETVIFEFTIVFSSPRENLKST